MTPAEKVVIIAENVPKVYKSAQDDMWLGILNTRANFAEQFKDWQIEYMRPPIKITPVTKGSANQMLRGNKLLKVVESAHFDFSQLLTGTTSQDGMYYTFYNCSALEKIEDVGIGEINVLYGFYNTFNGCSSLHTIEKVTVAETTRLSNVFNNCSALVNITFGGTIGQNGLNLQWSPLSKKSLESVVSCLSTTTSGLSVTLSKSAVNKAFETAEGLADGSTSAEWIALVPKNWTISLV
jgi:hypothetical protein